MNCLSNRPLMDVAVKLDEELVTTQESNEPGSRNRKEFNRLAQNPNPSHTHSRSSPGFLRYLFLKRSSLG